jgi:hypothetical protein
MKISWQEPNIQGSAITGYQVYIRQADDVTYQLEFTYCQKTDADMVFYRLCSIPAQYLH